MRFRKIINGILYNKTLNAIVFIKIDNFCKISKFRKNNNFKGGKRVNKFKLLINLYSLSMFVDIIYSVLNYGMSTLK